MATLKEVMEAFRSKGTINAANEKTRSSDMTDEIVRRRIFQFDEDIPLIFVDGTRLNLTERNTKAGIRQLLPPDIRNSTPTSVINEVFDRCRDNLDLQIDDKDNYLKGEFYINCLNGMIDIKTQKIKDNVPDYKPDYKLNFKYRSGMTLDNAPTYKKFVEMSVGMQQATILLQVIGSCLSSLLHCRAIFLFVGEGGTGKSTLSDFMEEIVPPGMVSHEPLHKIGTEQAKAHYRGRRLNIGRDTIADVIGNEESIKNLASCEWTTSRELYQTSIDFIPVLKFLYCSNHLPVFKHPDDALFDRLVIVTFPNKIPADQKDPHLKDKLLEERDAICSLACDSLKDLINSNYQYQMGEQAKEYIERQRHSLHSVEDFFTENLEITDKEQITSKNMFNQYSAWCDANALQPKGKHEFISDLTMAHPSIKYGKVGDKAHRVNGFSGVRFKAPDAPGDDKQQ